MRIIAIHGIGRHDADFHLAWKTKLTEVLGSAPEVIGLQWSDEQDQVADRFPVASGRLAGVMARIGMGEAADFRNSDAYKLIHSHLYDVFAYSFLHELRHYLQTQSLLDLIRLAAGKEDETVIVAHSLGTALAVHVVSLMRRLTGSGLFRGALLLASPLGIRSPIAGIPDPLAVSPKSTLATHLHDFNAWTPAERKQWADTREHERRLDEEGRNRVLLDFCHDWRADRLHFVVNSNDIVCSDVRFEGVGDLIRIKQGYSADERAIIGSAWGFHEVTFGAPRLADIGGNHDVINYLAQPVVADLLRRMFA